MSRVSINGILKPVTSQEITNQYVGHFLKVSYTQNINNKIVYSKDRVDVEEDGTFRFFLPQAELLGSQSVTIAVFAPDGEQMGMQVYSFNSLYSAAIAENVEDNTQPFVIDVDPKVIEFGESTPVTEAYRKLSGKVVDISGGGKISGLQLVIVASSDAHATLEEFEKYKAIFSSQTTQEGYFFGKIDNKVYEQAYGLIAGLEDAPIPITLDEHKIPKSLILVADMSNLSAEVVLGSGTPILPDATDMVGSSSFSQDIGGKCVDFTIPNRTLEEFSFYHTVRTTEPEIRGLTITARESKSIKAELMTLSDGLFTLFNRLNSSMNTLSVIPYTVDEEQTEATMLYAEKLKSMDASAAVSSIAMQPIYHLKIQESGIGSLKFTTQDLMPKKYEFSLVLKLLAEQARRKAKLQALHQELAAAYCGQKGAPEAQTYCETLTSKDKLNRATIESLLGHIETYTNEKVHVELFENSQVPKQLKAFVQQMYTLIEQPFVDYGLIAVTKTRIEQLIKQVDLHTEESQNQEELLGYLRRLIIEFAQASEDGFYTFEPCPTQKTETMGIMCMMQEFDDIKETLRNKLIFSLGEILKIRASYDIYIASISSFLSLLEKFHGFYSSSSKMLISLQDNYFIEHYSSTKSTLIGLKRQIYTAINKIEAIEQAYISNHPGRKELTVETSVDWDETPTIYENTTIAHGHILHFKQQWKADGYSLGDLLYSLPLAPCQEKQIAIVDWDREERATRLEGQSVSESLVANLSHDRDISEIIHSSFQENISASSHNKTSGTSAGIGGGIFGGLGSFVGGLFGGVSHSGASSHSSASQNASRNLSGSTLNRLQDNIAQSASALRSQRSTVVQTVGQNESVSVQTEVIKNNNHCHAMTVEYFEVLKHYAIEQNLVDVQECLFVPLPMSHFDHTKILRWKNTLRRFVYGSKLQQGFDAIERINNNYADSNLPDGSYADEVIENFNGHFTISFDLKRPYISTIEEATKTETYDLSIPFPWFFGVMKLSIDREVPLTEQEKDAIFERDYAPEIVRKFIETIDIYGIDENGNEQRLDLDLTLLSNYRKGVPLKVNIASKEKQNITRREIKHLRFRANTTVKASSKIILRSAFLYYQTLHLNEAIVRNARVNNDIINVVELQIDIQTPPYISFETKTDAALIYTPLLAKELIDPRKEDRDAASELVGFLNEHMEMAHKVIWSSLDASRLFGLLDGYIAPNAGGKSVASVVENKVMGVVGNNLVLKVVPGQRLDPLFRRVEDLVTFYQPTTKADPFRISVPTKGVYAESVMGKCNSCEAIDDTRHWKFDEAPCGTAPTAIDSVSTASRRSEVGNLQVKDLPTNIVNMQTAPAAPDPTGLGAAFTLLGQSGVFKDMTGLTGTQANALEALKTTSQSMTTLAGKAAELQKQVSMKKDIEKTLKTIQQAEKDKLITSEQKNKLANSALNSMVGKSETTEKKATTVTNATKAAESASKHNVSVNMSFADGTKMELNPCPKTQSSTSTTNNSSNNNG